MINSGPLLYKMMLHYGYFPFAANEGKRMSCDVFLIGIALLSRMRHGILWKDHGFCGQEPVTRERRPVDDIRLLFQSMASGNLHHLRNVDQSSADDDEDLLDVLVAIVGTTFQFRSSKWSYMRRNLLHIAAALPSSYSRDLQVSISLQDLNSLAELVVALGTRFVGAMLPSDPAVANCLTKGFCRQLNCDGDVDWETFRNTVLGSLV